LKHLTRLYRGRAAASLALAVISAACTSGKQSNQPTPAQASPQPAVSSSPTAGAASTAFQKWRTSQVVEAFKGAGLEVKNPRPMSRKPEDYGATPMIDIEATQFDLPSLGEDGRARIYNFASEDALEKMIKYYADASADNFSWVYVKDNILVQIDGRLEEEKAKQYETAMGNIKA
jgi:hypothetical protein